MLESQPIKYGEGLLTDTDCLIFVKVYKGKLMSGETVAVKVQRPYVLETVTVDLYLIRKFGLFLRR